MEYEKAKQVYLWLWFSPLLTIPTLVILLTWDPGYRLNCCGYAIEERITGTIAVLGSALWHLSLLKSARSKDSSLIRWHARQALTLAGLRTAVPFFFMFVFGFDSETLISIPILICIWLLGTFFGQDQAKQGSCTLARLFGHADELPGPPVEDLEQIPKTEKEIQDLVKMFRFSSNKNSRANALRRLEELGVVEDL